MKRNKKGGLAFLTQPGLFNCNCRLLVQYSTTTERSLRGHWQDVNNQKQFFQRLSEELGIEELSDWYRVSRREVRRRGGWSLFTYYPSLGHALKANYPDYSWEPARFIEEGTAPHGFWQNKTNLLDALNRTEAKLGIEKVEDWYSVAISELKEVGFPRVSKRHLAELLAEKYPQHNWDHSLLFRGRYSQQRKLEKQVAALFPGEVMQTNVRKNAGLLNPNTGQYLELDIYLSNLKLAFEYQELHHYKTTSYSSQSVASYQHRDEIKQILAASKGLTLLLIPCWWDGTTESLVATIKEARPELLPETTSTALPIPKEMPPEFNRQQKIVHIDDIGEPTTACFLTSVATNPTNWWLFEKYDGVRAFWNPVKGAFYSRHGTQLSISKEITQQMPQDTFLDGELWFGRDTFQEALKISSRADHSKINWAKLRYMVFDIPNLEGTYSQRYNELEVAPKEECRDSNHMESFLADIVDDGGEGIILRDPEEPYRVGRAPGYLKHKKFRDAEALLKREVGAQLWECQLPNGVIFTAPGYTGFESTWEPREGDVVSFKHRGFMLGSMKPKFPALIRVRTDLTWGSVMKDWKQQKPRSVALQQSKKLLGKRKKHANGYWQDRARRRDFFCRLAEELNFDPLQPANWAKVKKFQLLPRKGGAAILANFKGKLSAALEDAFPELAFPARATRRRNGYWLGLQRRREFFVQLAKDKGFDPVKHAEWNNVMTTDIKARPGGHAILSHAKGDLNAALLLAFPEEQQSFTEALVQRSRKQAVQV